MTNETRSGALPGDDPDSKPDGGSGTGATRSRTMSLTRKIGVLVIGVPLLAIGIALIPLPGPGSVLILAGLAVLSLEFAWADRMSRRIRDGFRTVLAKITGRS